MQDIIIVCAGSYGREMFWCLQAHNALAEKQGRERPYNILGFLSDVPTTLENYNIHAPVLGTIRDWHPIGNERYAMGIGSPKNKKMLAEMLRPRGIHFISTTGVQVVVPDDLKMGEGCYISNGSLVGCGVKMGDFVDIHASIIQSGACVESYSTTTGFTVVEDAVIHEGVYIGSKAVITSGCEVGSWSQVSAGSVVTQNVRPGVVVFGMPAQEIG